MPYRCDFYSDEEYQQALVLAEQQKEQIAFEEYAYEQYLREERIMFDKKTTNKEIIEALNSTSYHLTSTKHKEAIYNALDLINHLQAENTELLGKIEDLEANRVKLIENIEQLESVITQIKAEAYKEFAERLCEGRVSNDNTVILAKCLLNELVGDNNAGEN